MAEESKDNSKKNSEPSEQDRPEKEPSAQAPPEEDVLQVPGESTLPVEALLSMPPPASPRVDMPTELTSEDIAMLTALESSQMPEEASPPAPPEEMAQDERAQRLREALQGGSEALGHARKLSPRNLAKDTVSRGIDAALEAGGLRTPTPTPENP